MTKLSTKIEKATVAVKPAAKKTPAMPAAPKEAAKKIQQVLEKTEHVEVTATGKVIKSFQQMIPTESGRRMVGHPESSKVTVGKENGAKQGSARFTAIEIAQSCKTAGELYSKLATNWVNWLLKEGYVAISG